MFKLLSGLYQAVQGASFIIKHGLLSGKERVQWLCQAPAIIP